MLSWRAVVPCRKKKEPVGTVRRRSRDFLGRLQSGTAPLNIFTAVGTIRGQKVEHATLSTTRRTYRDPHFKEDVIRIGGSFGSGEPSIVFTIKDMKPNSSYFLQERTRGFTVFSRLIYEKEGYWCNWLRRGTLKILQFDGRHLEGYYSVTTNIGDTLRGYFNVMLPRR